MGKYKRKRSTSSSSELSGSIVRWGKKLKKFLKRQKDKKYSSSDSDSDRQSRSSHFERSRSRTQRERRSNPNGTTSRLSCISERDPEDILATEFIDIPDNDKSSVQETDPLADNTPTLSISILEVLGEERPSKEKTEEDIHKDIAARWGVILQKGLGNDIREKLVQKYPAIRNCPLVEAPKLNLEVKASLNELVIRIDARLASIQNQVGSSLSAIGQAITLLLEEEGNANIRLIELVSDAGRLLADLHCSETEARRALVAPNLNQKLKETLVDTPRDMWLFGKNLTDRIKDAKALERSSMEFKGNSRKFKPSSSTQSKKFLNSKGPPRPTSRTYRQGGQKQTPRRKTNRSNLPTQYHYNREDKRRY